MLHVSMMMRIFYIDWQQHWECDRTINIGANAHGKRTVSTKQPQLTDLTSVSPLVGHPVTSERYWACFQVTRLFHSATIFCCYICICCLKLHRADYQVEGFFLPRFGWGPLSSNVFTICAVYWSLGRRGYFGVSNVALVDFVSASFFIFISNLYLFSLSIFFFSSSFPPVSSSSVMYSCWVFFIFSLHMLSPSVTICTSPLFLLVIILLVCISFFFFIISSNGIFPVSASRMPVGVCCGRWRMFLGLCWISFLVVPFLLCWFPCLRAIRDD